ncbi:ABC transporter permease [Paracoccus saliphilus]|uniref:ABC transporter permease n=1 Tax=Paracoccus saliphilus TaxID=405559 RepID=A0AA45W6J6_9RHOB|nr:ABC transporter permease [Paracoccus saliphilus]WCR02922.1 ABC transporter permease [Paracoccus saliphilus]SIT02907.1 peptide/nickel transport system permease protein [Paracoccus saliphilus]
MAFVNPSDTAIEPQRKMIRRITAIPGMVIFGLFWLGLIVLCAVFVDLLRPYDITQMDLSARLLPPGTPGHWLGTDELGRDVLSRLIQSVRVSLVIAFGATIISAIFGTTLGFLAAKFRGVVEHFVVMLADFQAALPFLIMSLAVLAFFGSSMVLLVCLMGFYGWERYARIARGLAISAGAQGYAEAVVQLGATPRRVYLRHILPNVASTLIVSMTLTFPEIILMESGLSFLGLGVQPPETSLGNMVGFGREYLTTAPWIMLFPAILIMLTTLSISLVGDWLRDKLDPTIR